MSQRQYGCRCSVSVDLTVDETPATGSRRRFVRPFRISLRLLLPGRRLSQIPRGPGRQDNDPALLSGAIPGRTTLRPSQARSLRDGLPAGSRASYSQLIAGGSRVISSVRGAPVRRRNSAGLRSCVVSPVLVFLRTSLAPGRVPGPSSASRTRLARFVRRSRLRPDCHVYHMTIRSQPAPEPKQSGAPPIRPGIALSLHCLVRCAALPARYRPSVSRLIVQPSPPVAGREVVPWELLLGLRAGDRASASANRYCGSLPLRVRRTPTSLVLAPAGARAGLSSSEPLSVPFVRRIVALGPRCPFRLCATCRARPGPAHFGSSADPPRAVCQRLVEQKCLVGKSSFSPAPLPGCGRIAWPKCGHLRSSWLAAKEHLAPCWAGSLCVHSRQELEVIETVQG